MIDGSLLIDVFRAVIFVALFFLMIITYHFIDTAFGNKPDPGSQRKQSRISAAILAVVTTFATVGITYFVYIRP